MHVIMMKSVLKGRDRWVLNFATKLPPNFFKENYLLTITIPFHKKANKRPYH